MALIPPFFIDCVVAIGIDTEDNKKTWIATGFLYGHSSIKDKDGKQLYNVYLVTNRHVFENLSSIYLRFNPQTDEQAKDYKVLLNDTTGKPTWFAHPNPDIDIAVIPINYSLLQKEAMQVAFFNDNIHSANIDKMISLEITEGDFAYVLGFPMGITGERRNAVIVRSGSIARIRDVIAKANNTFLVDAFIFPGNSGGPVILKPEALSIQGTKGQDRAYLIGIVHSYLSYTDVAISRQTKKPRVIFEENSGLAAVHPVDYIDEAINEAVKAKVN